MPRFLIVLPMVALMAAAPARAARAVADVPQLVFPPVDVERLLAEDASREDDGPARFAEPIPAAITPETDGAWDVEPDGTRTWRLRIRVPAATDLNLGFTRFDIPQGASLEVLAEDVPRSAGPYARQHATDGQLWTPALPGDSVLVVLALPAGSPEPALELGQVGAGYRDFGRDPRVLPRPNSGACNIDVACPEADPWRDEIDSVALYSVNGTDQCTGSLLMDVPRTFTPWFLTADHCPVNTGNVASIVTYWNYQREQCAGARDLDQVNQTLSGASIVARRRDVDFMLLRLAATPPAAFNPYWAGWDRSDVPPSGTVTVHHPSTDEKAISFNDDPLTHRNSCIGSGTNTHWHLDNYELGTTEGGSSGSGLLDADSHRIVGWLSGGAAWCGFVDFDCYGRFAVGWDGATPAERLRDWLDPAGLGLMGMDGARPAPGIELDSVFAADTCDVGGPGEGNAALDTGESAALVITLLGNGNFQDVQGTLSTSTPGVAIPDRLASWPDLVAGSPAVSLAPHFTIRPGMGLSCGARLDFTLTVTASSAGAFELPFSVDMASAATCQPCLASCVVEEIATPPLGMLRMRKAAGGDVVLTYPQATWCGGAIQVRMAPTARPAALPGSWPDDPIFADVSYQDLSPGPDFVHAPPGGSHYYLIVETGSGGAPGPSGSY